MGVQAGSVLAAAGRTIAGVVKWAVAGAESSLQSRGMRRGLRWAVWAAVAALAIARLLYLAADFPNYSPWMADQAKFTDEGWWGSAAAMQVLTGHWYVAGDYNPAVALPVWPVLLSLLFHFTGVSVVAARALNVTISLAALGVVYALVRRYSSGKSRAPALAAVLLMAASPFAFAFSRLAILDTLVVFEFCALLLAASYATPKRIWPLIAMAALIPIAVLTKTTAAVLVPAVFWLAWNAMGCGKAGLVKAVLAVAVVPAVVWKGYGALAARLGYGADYKYFFDVNAMPDIDWRQSWVTLAELLQNGFWVDRILYPAAIAILVLTVAWKRKLWSNPLFAASWLAIGAEAAFIFSRQDDYAPRYFLAMLAPVVWVVVLALDEAAGRSKTATVLLLAAIAASVGANAGMTAQFLPHRTYRFINAAESIRTIVRGDRGQKPLIFGVSGAQLTLMAGIPSISDAYGTEEMAEKVARYKPGWYVAWNTVTSDNRAAMAGYRLEQVSSYPVFDDDDRNLLILYRLTPRTQ